MKPLQPIELTHAEPVDRRGHRTNHTLLLIRARDVLLAEAAQFFPSPSDRETARRLRRAMLTYRNGRWRRDCNEETCPPQHAGTHRLLFWAILKLHDHAPCDRTVRTAAALARSTRSFPCPPASG